MAANPKTVITYGTFDLFHHGHRRLLERAKELGDRLIVGVTAESYDKTRGKLNVRQGLVERIENVRASGLADKIIVEEYVGQKAEDIHRYDVDIFAIGSDWAGSFDYLKKYCDVVYLERTSGISSTELRDNTNGLLRIGVAGTGRIANRFAREAIFVSGVEITSAYGRDQSRLDAFVNEHGLSSGTTDFAELLAEVDAVYIATPHLTHYELARAALSEQKHVLCEKPATLSADHTRELYELARTNQVVFLEAIKTAYAPGFVRMVSVARSGLIGDIVAVDASFTKLESPDGREFQADQAGGSVTELASYPLLGAVKLLGAEPDHVSFESLVLDGVDHFTRINLWYPTASASLKVGLGAKTEGHMVVTGTKGYIYVPAPWWKTEYFELRFEDPSENRVYSDTFAGDGLRYEIAELVTLVNEGTTRTHKLTEQDSQFIATVIEQFRDGVNVHHIEPAQHA